MKRIENARVLLSAMAFLALTASAQAADLDTIRVVPDLGVSERTNMGRAAGDVGELRVSFDPGVMARTNVHRVDEGPALVHVVRDAELMRRTNMGGSALPQQPLSTAKAR